MYDYKIIVVNRGKVFDLFDFEFGFFRDKSVSGHSVTVRETVAVSSAEISGAIAYEVSGKANIFGIFCSLFLFLAEVLDPKLMALGL